jgi:hypothetical protein
VRSSLFATRASEESFLDEAHVPPFQKGVGSICLKEIGGGDKMIETGGVEKLKI